MRYYQQNGNHGCDIEGRALAMLKVIKWYLIISVKVIYNDLFINTFREASPSDSEVMRSIALADLKKRNAAELDEKRRLEKIEAGQTVNDVNEPQPMDHEKAFYPKYKEYEIMPGEGVKEGDRWKDYKNPYAKEHKT